MPRYVLLWHEMPPDADRASHWDFMLEREGVLWTWTLETLPATWREQCGLSYDDASVEVMALRLGDHRLEYLEYEGPVSGDRGNVERVAAGEFTWIRDGEDRFELTLGGNLISNVALTPNRESAAAASAARETFWRLHAAKIAPK